MRKLISMTDYVLEVITDKTGKSTLDYRDYAYNKMLKIENYANFLKQKLSIEMFVPCKLVEGVWVVLEEPKENDLCGSFFDMQVGFHQKKEYQEAKDRVLFEGFKLTKMGDTLLIEFKDGCVGRYYSIDNMFEWYCITIEDLVKYNLELTASAQKHFF